MILSFNNLCQKLFVNNFGFFILIILKCVENYPFQTNHKSYKYNEKEKSLIIIKENLFAKFTCICPFFQLLINILLLKKTNLDSNNFFFTIYSK